MEVDPLWLHYKPLDSLIKDGIILMWGIQIKTDTLVLTNRPDIIQDEKEKLCCILDVIVVPVNKNSVKKIVEIITKYRDIDIEILKC